MKKLFILALALVFSLSVYAQAKEWGRVSASLESLDHFYVKDAVNGFVPSDLPQFDGKNGVYASNNFLKVDYFWKGLSAGLQVEGFFPSTVGYPIPENKLSLSNLYVDWRGDSFSVTAGTFYDQLGSGLLFRSWEDRTLGINNAVLGARATYSWEDRIAVKVFTGVPRLGRVAGLPGPGQEPLKFFGLGYTGVDIAAADAALSLSNLTGMDNMSLALEGSVLYKHEKLGDLFKTLGFNESTLGWSARVKMETSGFFANAEYVDPGKLLIEGDDSFKGNAQLLELGYNGRGLGVTFTGRRIYRMAQKIYNYTSVEENAPVECNILSYCPALTSQHTYMLMTLNPYSPEIGNAPMKGGEIGGQIDAYYNFRRGTKIGGKRGMKVHANFSTWYSLNQTGGTKGGDVLFTDFCLDVEKQWTRKFKSVLMYSMQDYNKHSDGYYVGLSHIAVADLLYKWTSSFSTRLELQYLASDDYMKDWLAGLLEVSFAPHWSIFASDMWNHGDSGKHYYNAGVSFTMEHLRVSAGYGRYRAGYLCSGGVCRMIPAYTGANLTLTASF